MKINIENLVSWTKGKFYGDSKKLKEEILRISTDSRDDTLENCAFLALVGENFDGHQFLNNAIQKKVSLAIVQRVDQSLPVAQILVENCGQAYLDIANNYKKKINPITIAIVGSCGKTTTKDLLVNLYQNYASDLKITFTKKNYNNLIGVPKTILEMENDCDVLILELGINQIGEMEKLAKCSMPSTVVLTGFGQDHLEFLKNEAIVIEQNLKVFDIPETQKAFYWQQPDLENIITQKPNTNLFVLFESQINHFDTNWDSKESSFIFNFDKKDINVELPLVGKYNAKNAALSVGTFLNLTGKSLNDISFKNFNLTKHRSSFLTLENNLKVYDDSYNSNPTSMKELQKMLLDYPGKIFYILGGMKELGENSNRFHQEIFDLVGEESTIFIGSEWNHLQAKNFYSNVSEISLKQLKELKLFDLIVLKGSRSYGLEKLIKQLKEL